MLFEREKAAGNSIKLLIGELHPIISERCYVLRTQLGKATLEQPFTKLLGPL